MECFHHRYGEKAAYTFRSERFFNVKDEWWFAIRRGADQGPYPSKTAAKQALIEFINNQISFENHLSNAGLSKFKKNAVHSMPLITIT